MGLSIGRNGNIVYINLDDTDDMDCRGSDHQLYFLYDYTDYGDTEAENVELVVSMILDRMRYYSSELVVTTHDELGNSTGVYKYPCSFKTFKYDYEMCDIFYYDYFYGYINLPDVSEEELMSVGDMISHNGTVSVIYKDKLKLVVPIIDMLSGAGSDFYDKVIFNKYETSLIPYLTDEGFTIKDLQRNYNNLGFINKDNLCLTL